MTTFIVAVSVITTCCLTAYFLAPRLSQARVTSSAPVHLQAARSENHQKVLDGLGALVSSSAAILAIHPRDQVPYLEIVLRTHAASDEDGIAADEIALISHSEILQTITLYQLAETEGGGHHSLAGFWGWPHVTQRAFADRWRSHPKTTGRILATGVSGMRLEQIDKNQLLIGLTWSAESADGRDEASAVIVIPQRPQL